VSDTPKPKKVPLPPNPLDDPEDLRKSRSDKVLTQLDGDDEFSVASLDPKLRRQSQAYLRADDIVDGRPQSTQHARTLWRLFRKIFT
jgi:hypothetical protein